MNEAGSAYRPDRVTPPGETLKESIEALGMTQAELARRMGRPLKTINEIINGKAAIMSDTALQLERVLGIPASFWMNLERNYRLTSARLAEAERLVDEVDLAKLYPYRELAQNGYVRETRVRSEQVLELLAFFGVNSLNAIQYPGYSLRVARQRQPSRESLAAWFRMGELQGQGIQVESYDAKRLMDLVPNLRGLTTSRDQGWSKQLQTLCASAGVAVVYVPHLPKTYVHGVTRWLSQFKALVQLSLRGCYADIFWFTFFHELGHILKHGKRETFIEGSHPAVNPREAEADEFAARVLIADDDYGRFVRARMFDEQAVLTFASAIRIHPGIVVGRLQRDDYLDHNRLNGLRAKLTFASE